MVSSHNIITLDKGSQRRGFSRIAEGVGRMLDSDSGRRTGDPLDGSERVSRSTNCALAGALFDEDWRGLVGFLRRRLGGNQQAAEDMAQEALARIAGSRREYHPDRARGLLYSIARRLLVDHFRAERTRRGAVEAIGLMEEDIESLDPLRTLVAREDLVRVRRAIVDLPPRCRQVFVLNRFENMSYSAIARHCEISVSMVEKHMNRALRQLSLALEAEPDVTFGVDEDE